MNIVDLERDLGAQARSQMSRKIVAALEQLPAGERAALCLRDIEGLPLAVVADKLECSLSVARGLIASGRINLLRSVKTLPDGAESLPFVAVG